MNRIPASIPRRVLGARPGVWQAWLTAGLCCLGLHTQAVGSTLSLVQPYVFNAASQSFWGGGTGYSFGSKGEKGWSALNFGWDIGADTGTVSAAIAGDLRVDYPDLVSASGPFSLGLSFTGQPDDSWLSSQLGAWAKITAGLLGGTVNLLDEGFVVRPNEQFTARPGQPARAASSAELAGVGVDIGVFNTGVSLGLEQTNTLLFEGISGQVTYGMQGSSIVSSVPFAITSTGITMVQAELPSCGLWDFLLTDLTVNTRFSAGFDLELNLYETHVDGLKWCSKKFWGITLKWPCGLTYDTSEFKLADFDLYNGKPFALDFDPVANSPSFTIRVVPEPGSAALLLLALLVAAWGRQRGLRRSLRG